MYIVRILTVLGNTFEVNIEDKDVLNVSNVLEKSDFVECFWIRDIIVPDQKIMFGAGKEYRKWKIPDYVFENMGIK